MRIFAVDPGIRHCGVASFYDRQLTHAALVRNVNPSEEDPPVVAQAAFMAHQVLAWVATFGSSPAWLVVEWPQVYQGSKQKGDPNDLLALAAVDAALVDFALRQLWTVQVYKPRDWKGQVPKDVMERRIRSKLDEAETRSLNTDLSAWAPKSLQHNMIDAVGIGLKALGRL